MNTEERLKEIDNRLCNTRMIDRHSLDYLMKLTEDIVFLLWLSNKQMLELHDMRTALNAIVVTGTKETSTILPERSLATCVEIAKAALGEEENKE